ncbi:MAG: peptide/nickel transport system substrate-binding protein, partial [Solirubrobacteraceae bacterium]|nr:peptide/nickel transport system substrate-binding protein [Solirubrobacteraceae bacterium]
MKRSFRWTLLAGLVTALALFAAACGSSSKSGGGGGSSTTSTGTQVTQGKQGGKLTYLAAGDIDYLDPGQTYYTFGYMVQYAVNRTLYSFKPDDAQTPVPDIADGQPQISSDNKTITVKIKKGIKFAPPVNREVTTKDIKYGIERAFTSNVPSGYATSYFAEIDGAPQAPVKISALKDF